MEFSVCMKSIDFHNYFIYPIYIVYPIEYSIELALLFALNAFMKWIISFVNSTWSSYNDKLTFSIEQSISDPGWRLWHEFTFQISRK